MLMTAWPYWPRPPVWRTNLPDLLDGPADRLAVGDLRAADVRVDGELYEAVDDDLEMELAHAGDEGLARLLVRGRGRSDPPRRGAQALPSLSWSAFVFGSIATEMTGSGNSIDSSRIGAESMARVSPVVVA